MDSFMAGAINILAYIHVNSPHSGVREYTLTEVDIPFKGKGKENTDINMHLKERSPNHCSKNAKKQQNKQKKKPQLLNGDSNNQLSANHPGSEADGRSELSTRRGAEQRSCSVGARDVGL